MDRAPEVKDAIAVVKSETRRQFKNLDREDAETRAGNRKLNRDTCRASLLEIPLPQEGYKTFRKRQDNRYECESDSDDDDDGEEA